MMFKLSNATRTAVSAIALSFAASAMPVVAQAQEAAAPSEPRWFKTCAKQEESDVCVVQNQLVAANGQLITAVGLITVEGKVNRKLLQVTVPSARLIPPGVLMQIDGAKGTKLDYAVCLPDRCTAEIPLTEAIIDSLKKLLGIKWLLDKIRSARTHGLNRHRHVSLTRHKNQRGLNVPID